MQLKKIYRVVVFVPSPDLQTVISAVTEAFELENGSYKHVLWFTTLGGIEQFSPIQGANPTLGTVGELTENPSTRLEFSIPRSDSLLKELIEVVSSAHPWEQPVINISEQFEA